MADLEWRTSAEIMTIDPETQARTKHPMLVFVATTARPDDGKSGMIGLGECETEPVLVIEPSKAVY